MPKIQRLTFVVNEQKAGASDIAATLRRIAIEQGVDVETYADFPMKEGILKGRDACCVIGGDGTLLGVAAEAARLNVPVIGVNRGTLGFLTTFSAEEAVQHFAELLEGKFSLAYRSLLQCTVGPGQQGLALNDVLIKDTVNSRIVSLEVFADDELVTRYYSDGVIFSTPTGSTAYNLSAGGPIIHPGAEVIAMTPICPHTLSNRSIIFHHDVCLKVHNRTGNGTLLVALDGQRTLLTSADEPIRISLSDVRLPLAQGLNYEHFGVIRQKLKWSGGYAERD